MNILFSFFAVLLIIVTVIIGVETPQLEFLFGVIFPYAAVATFLLELFTM